MIAATCNPGPVFMLIIIVAGGVYILADARNGGPGGGLFGLAKPKRPMWWTEMSEASPRTLRAEIERITPLADAGNVAAIRYRVELRRYFEEQLFRAPDGTLPLPPEVQTAAPKQIIANPGKTLTVGREVFRGTLKEVRR